MGTYVDRYWPGNPGGYTPKTRRAGDFRAYVPDLLADLDLHIPAGLADSVTGVTRQLDSLNAGQPGLEQLEPMARFLLRSEAVASSWMEGLTIGVRRLARAEAASRADLELHDDTAQAVLGNIHAIDKALDIAGDPARPVTVDDILTIHEATLARTKDARWSAPSWRTSPRTSHPHGIRRSSRQRSRTCSSRPSTPSLTGTGGRVAP